MYCIFILVILFWFCFGCLVLFFVLFGEVGCFEVVVVVGVVVGEVLGGVVVEGEVDMGVLFSDVFYVFVWCNYSVNFECV